MKPYIYLVKNQTGKIVYIGQQIGTKSLEEYKGSGLLLHRAYKKYGEETFIREIIDECSLDELNLKETYYINIYNTKFPHGYNLTNGGEGLKNYKYSSKQKENISKAKLGQKYPKSHGSKIRDKKLGVLRSKKVKNKISKTKASKHNLLVDLNLKGNFKSNSQKIIIQLDLNNQKLNEFDSAQQAGRCLGKNGNQIADCASGRQKTAFGFKWKYKQK